MARSGINPLDLIFSRSGQAQELLGIARFGGGILGEILTALLLRPAAGPNRFSKDFFQTLGEVCGLYLTRPKT